MATITASDVKELRRKTGAGMMECKKALVSAEGDVAKAEEFLAKAGQKKVAKAASRVAAEGVMFVKSHAGKAAMVEINCETDFAAKDSSFNALGDEVVALALANNVTEVDALLKEKLASGNTVEEESAGLTARIGEKISLRRVCIKEASEGEYISHYRHGTRIGSVVILRADSNAEELARDVALHVAGMKPDYIGMEDVPADVLAKEKDIFLAQVKDSGKPANIIEKMIEGKLNKHFANYCLLLQPFVKDGDITVSELLAKAKASVVSFERLEVGEGIEKVETNFAEEVMAQAKGV